MIYRRSKFIIAGAMVLTLNLLSAGPVLSAPPGNKPRGAGDEQGGGQLEGERRPARGDESRSLVPPAVKSVISTRLLNQFDSRGLEVSLLLPEQPRYKEGAPLVVITVPAIRWNPASRQDGLGLTGQGFSVIQFAYPAGPEFDEGGPKCKRAVADVLLFAMGRKTDNQNRSINQLATLPVLTGLVGAVGMSHGGNAVVTTLEDYAPELSTLAFYVSFESPCGTGKARLGDSIVTDYGAVRNDSQPFKDGDGNGLPWDDFRNPFYTSEVGLDFSRLAWDGAADDVSHRMQSDMKGALFLDGNGNGKLDLAAQDAGRPDLQRGGRRGKAGGEPGGKAGPETAVEKTADVNLDGRLDANEDYPLPCFTSRFDGKLKRVYSVSVTRAAANSVWKNGFPPDVATVAEATEYWSQRDMAAGFDRLGPMSNLLVCIYAGRQDHVQAQTDYPHIRAQYDGLRRAGIKWVKLNPDPVYARAIVDLGTVELPANRPNVELAPQTVWRQTEPMHGLAQAFVTAAACELADRVRSGQRQDLLKAPLFPDAPRTTAKAPAHSMAAEQLKAAPGR